MSERSPAELILAHQKRIDEYNGEEPDGATALGCCNQSIATTWIADANARSGRGPSSMDANDFAARLESGDHAKRQTDRGQNS
jgi:hypothetical protein